MTDCLKITIPAEACYIRLADGKHAGSRELPERTPAGDWVFLVFDQEDQLIGIELVGDKPCQISE